jgi:hypothetical protein
MKTLHLAIIIISISGLLLGASNSIYAPCPVGVIDCGPPPGVTVSTGTDSQFYEKNDTINVQGKVYVQNYNQPIQVHIINPENVTVQSIDAPVINGKFGLNIGANFDEAGFYQIITCVQSWCDRSYFKFVAQPYKLTVNSQDYFIKYKSVADLEKIEADSGVKALRIHIANATAQGLQFVIELPRNLIDSKSQNNTDMNFTVLVGENQPDKFMQNANFKEIATTSYSRTLQIDIPYDPIPDVQGIWDIKIAGTTFLRSNATNLSPLQQFKSGIAANNVKCQQDLQLVIKSEDSSPACVKLASVKKLVLLQWALKPDNELTVEELKDAYKAGEKIDFTIKYKGLYTCGYPSSVIKDIENKTVWKSPTAVVLCDPDTGYGEYKWKFGELYTLILNQTGSYHMIISFADKTLEKEFEIK